MSGTDNRISIQVRQMAADKGHFIPQVRKKQPGRWKGVCAKCGMEACYRIMPRPGDQNFYGQALTEECDG